MPSLLQSHAPLSIDCNVNCGIRDCSPQESRIKNSPRRAHVAALRHSNGAPCVQESAEDVKLSLLRILRFLFLGFRYRLALLPDQVYQGLAEWKLVFDGLDYVPQFIFTASKGAFFVARRHGEIERVIPDRVPWEAVFQKPILVDRQDKKELANPLSHSNHRVNQKSGE